MLAVVCVKVGDKYNSEHVNRLYRMVKRHLICELKFICYTDNPQGIDNAITSKEPPCDYPRWWCKLGLLKEDLDTDGIDNILYLDLDVVIVSSLHNMLKVCMDKGGFWIMKDAWHDTYNSSVMFFKKGLLHDVFASFDMSQAREGGGVYRSDQDWISVKYPDCNLLPNILSYKGHLRYQNNLPSNTDIVIFHGTPNADNAECRNLPWVRKHYYGENTHIPTEHKRIGFAIGNGESRRGYDINKLKDKGFAIGCNALYREFKPNLLVATDPLLIEEIRTSYSGATALRGDGRMFNIMIEQGIPVKLADQGMASGPSSVYLSVCMGINKVYLLGHDITTKHTDGEMNNMYKGTPGYRAEGNPVYTNFISQMETIFFKSPHVEFTFVSDREWLGLFSDYKNVTHLSYAEFEDEVGFEQQ